MLELSGANIFAGILFGAIGTGAFIYGKKQGSLAKMIIGGLLLIYPFCFSSTLFLYVLGVLLTICLFVFKD